MEWKEVPLSEVLEQYNEKITIDDKIEYKQVTVSKTGNITLREVKKGSLIGTKKQNVAKKGWFVYSRLGFHDGAFGVIPEELDNSIVTGDMPLFIIKDNILPQFLLKSLSTDEFKEQVKGVNKGTAQTRIRENKFLKFKIKLPDIDIQKEIVKKYLDFERKIKELNIENKKQEIYIKKLKEQILTDAIQGKLTKQDENDEPASILLEKIKKEKEQLIKEKKIKKEKPLEPIDKNKLPFEIPKNWAWCRLGSLLKSLVYGTSKKCNYDSSLIPVLRIPNVKLNTIDYSDLKFSSFSESEINKLKLKDYDFLLVRSNGSLDLVGRISMFKNSSNYTFVLYAGYLIRLRFFLDLINPLYILLYSNTRYIREQIEKPIRSTTGLKNINSTEVSNLIISIPPLGEQNRIVEIVEEKMEKIKQLEKQVQQDKLNIERLKKFKLQELFSNNKEVIKRKEVILN